MKQTKFKDTEIGKIPQEWEVSCLADHIELIGGGTPKTTVDEYWDGEIPWISVVDFVGDKRWIYNTEKHITKEGLENSSTKLLHKGQLIISARGTVGELGQITKDMAFNQSCYGIDGKEDLNNDYLYYLLKLKVREFQQKGHGAVFNTITKDTFRQIVIPLPELTEQLTIAKILSSLDEKIELNQQMNKTLEAIGRTLFKHWFVDFEFPNEKGRPYKSSGGKMVESELGKIPKGWTVGKLGDFIDIVKGVSYRSAELMESEKALVTLKSIDRGGGLNNDGFKEYTGEYKKAQELMDGDIVVAHTDITQKAEVLGQPAIVRKIKKYKVLIASLDLSIIRPKNTQTRKAYLYYLLKSDNFQNHAAGYANGTTVLHLSSKAVPEYVFIVPDINLVSRFTEIIGELLDKKMENEAEIEILSQVHDSLLPRLMSGRIRVPIGGGGKDGE